MNDNTKLYKKDIIDWIYAQQIIPKDKGESGGLGGFRGGPFLGIPFDNNNRNESDIIYNTNWDRVNIAATYNGICTLLLLGDDLSRLNKKALLNTLNKLQCKNGSFSSMQNGENDMRFVFCAVAIAYFLDDFSSINVNLCVNYIKSSQTYCGAFGMGSYLEGHGGATYVAVASLAILNSLNVINKDKLIRWCLINQGHGFIGRPEKPPDSCYSFWTGAVLNILSQFNNGLNDSNINSNNKLINYYKMCNNRFNRVFLMLCQSGFGGYSKYPNSPYPDILHSYLGLAGLSLIGQDSNFVKTQANSVFICNVSKNDLKKVKKHKIII